MSAFLPADIHQIYKPLSSQIISLVCLTPFKNVLQLYNRLLQKGLLWLDWASASHQSETSLAASIALNEFQESSLSTASHLSMLAFLKMVFRQIFYRVSTAQIVILTRENYPQRTAISTFSFLIGIQSWARNLHLILLNSRRHP